MCEVMDKVINEGLTRGRNEGLREGIREGRREGHREGHREGLNEGLSRGLISTCKDFMLSYSETAAKLKEKYGFSDEETEKNMKLYW